MLLKSHALSFSFSRVSHDPIMANEMWRNICWDKGASERISHFDQETSLPMVDAIKGYIVLGVTKQSHFMTTQWQDGAENVSSLTWSLFSHRRLMKWGHQLALFLELLILFYLHLNGSTYVLLILSIEAHCFPL